MKIEFDFMGNKIPTSLAVKVDDRIQVHYSRLNDCFGFEFKLYGANDNDDIEAIVEEIASDMESQSYDHGSEWRRTWVENLTPENKEFYEPFVFHVYFRIKDSY
jgi:hypothetical protein